ncbi:hypothetical protein WICPIJ_002299 [Wickerhamomyces pijperi]|uniref:Uncharacterized protein n=1 Tax=Wickerhamomyces pijperi TaxID=599730 RepID=A0A9P8TPZ2_WICPI|nr:hypothetical protein WICPIJ_002299 [Wickerhamomyces pijperi]
MSTFNNKQFKQVDVFVQDGSFQGNPVAVFFFASNLSDEEMQRIANWTNLSETTFVLPPSPSVTTPAEHTYRLRIFTPDQELPFAGHPTIGSAHAVMEAGLVCADSNGKIYQECKAGLVELTVAKDTGAIRFKLPYYKHTVYDTESSLIKKFADALGTSSDQIEHSVLVDDGPEWLTLLFKSGEVVKNIQYDSGKFAQICSEDSIQGVSIFGPFSEDSEDLIENSLTYEARNLFMVCGSVIEDPVCGSGAGADGSVLAECEGFEGNFIIRQGRNVTRDGVIRVNVVKKTGEEGSDIHVGGKAVTIIDGKY